MEEAKLLRSFQPFNIEEGIITAAPWDKDSIRELIGSNDKAVWRGLEVLLARQTADERQAGQTAHLNGRGFNGRDANFGTSLAEKVIDWRKGVSGYRSPLSPRQLDAARKMLRKYAGQLAKVANGE